MQKNKIGSGVMSALAWNAKRILLLLSWIFVCVVLMIVLPEHKIISFIMTIYYRRQCKELELNEHIQGYIQFRVLKITFEKWNKLWKLNPKFKLLEMN